MKFTDFKTVKKAEIREKVAKVLDRLPEGNWGGHRVIREGSAPRWQVQDLRGLDCIECEGDLIKSPSKFGADNIKYFTCQANSTHKFVLIERLSPTRQLLAAASSILGGGPPPLTDADLEALDLNLDHMGRMKD